MNKPMTNLEKIRKAYAMNYAAQLEYEGHVLQVLFVRGKDLVLRFIGGENDGQVAEGIFENDFKITEFLYMGQLGGNEEPEDGQKFRVKKTDKIFNYEKRVNEFTYKSMIYKPSSHSPERFNDGFCKSELEPVFD